jgi:hypothetical protein
LHKRDLPVCLPLLELPMLDRDNPVKAGLAESPEQWPWSSAVRKIRRIDLPL